MPSHPIRPLVVAVFVLGVVALGTPSHAQDRDPWEAAARGDLATLQQALASGVDPDAREPNGASPLIVAAMFGHADLVRALIEHDADLDLRNNDGASALHVAALFGHPDSVALLLEAGAATDLPNNDDLTPLDMVLAPLEHRGRGHVQIPRLDFSDEPGHGATQGEASAGQVDAPGRLLTLRCSRPRRDSDRRPARGETPQCLRLGPRVRHRCHSESSGRSYSTGSAPRGPRQESRCMLGMQVSL